MLLCPPQRPAIDDNNKVNKQHFDFGTFISKWFSRTALLMASSSQVHQRSSPLEFNNDGILILCRLQREQSSGLI